MSSPSFRFRQFEVWHDRCAMKVGTDAVLLGAWCEVDSSMPHARILDIGTGSGVVALMMAQRWEGAQIDGVEIDEQAALQAQENCLHSPWAHRMQVIHQSVQTFAQAHEAHTYDLIVSNPPYFQNSLKNPDAQRQMARHTDELSSEELLFCAAKMLKKEGTLALILPAQQKEVIVTSAVHYGLSLRRLTWVHTRPGLEPKRVLLSFTLSDDRLPQMIETHLNVEAENAPRSEEYSQLTKDFYL